MSASGTQFELARQLSARLLRQQIPFILSTDGVAANGQQVQFTSPVDWYVSKLFCSFSLAPTGGNNEVELRVGGVLLATAIIPVNTLSGSAALANVFVPAGSLVKIDQTVHPAAHGHGLIAWLTVLPG